MTKLAILDEPITFPPRRFLLIVWGLTMAIAIYGFIATPRAQGALYVWSVIAAVAFWQLWTLRWVRIDRNGIEVWNIFMQRRSLQWEEVTRFHEEEVRLNKGTYAVLLLSNEGAGAQKRKRKISLTNDQQNFSTLRDIVRECVPRGEMGG